MDLEGLRDAANKAAQSWVDIEDPGDWHSADELLRTDNVLRDEVADARFIAAASPDVVLALIEVAEAAKALGVPEARTSPKVRRLAAALAALERPVLEREVN